MDHALARHEHALNHGNAVVHRQAKYLAQLVGKTRQLSALDQNELDVGLFAHFYLQALKHTLPDLFAVDFSAGSDGLETLYILEAHDYQLLLIKLSVARTQFGDTRAHFSRIKSVLIRREKKNLAAAWHAGE